jgi:phosphatidylinositol-3-phosphatase
MRFKRLSYSGMIVGFSSVLAVAAHGQNDSPSANVNSSVTTTSISTEAPQDASQQLASGATIGSSTTRHIKTVWVINMENKNWTGDTLAHNIKGNPEAPYINNTLIRHGARAVNYVNLIHPSEPNKIWEEAGSNLGVTDGGSVASNHQRTTNHLVTKLAAAGKTWKVYDEYTDGRTCPFANWHTGIIFFDDVTNNRNPNYAPCIHHFRPFRELQTDLNSNRVANYNYINPGLCHEMHPGPGCTTFRQQIQQGDAWLAREIPSIMASQAYKNGGAIFIIWDEVNWGRKAIPAIVLSPFIKPGYVSYTTYNHNSLLRTIQEIFGVYPLIRGASTAHDMREMFKVFP